MTQYAGQNFAVHTAQTETSSVGDTARIHQTPSPRQKVSLQLLLMILGIATISINDARIAGYPISDYFMVASLALVCLTILSGKRRLLAAGEMRKAPPIFVVGAIVFISGATLSTFSSADPGTSVALIGRIAWVTLGVFWVLRLLTRNRSAIRYFVTAYRATTLISSTVAILGSVGVLATDTIGNERQMAFFGHPNSLATCLTVGLPFLLLPNTPDGQKDRAKDRLFLRLALTGYTLVAVATTGSVTGVAGGVVSLGVAVFLTSISQSNVQRRMHPFRVLTLMALVGIGIGMFIQSDTQVSERFTDMQEGRTESHESRGDFNALVMERFDERLLLGVGLDERTNQLEFELNVADSDTGFNHNMYLRMLNGAGLPALLGLLTMLAVSVNHGTVIALNNRTDPLRTVAIAAVASCVGAMANNFFQPAAFERYFWFPVLLIGVLWQLRREETRQQQILASGSGRVDDRSAPVHR